MTAGTVNIMVRTVKLAHTRYDLAKVGKQRRKLAERPPVTPLTREQRVRNYANGRGWTADFTPAQRRRLDKKENQRYARNSPYITKVDGTKTFTTEGIK